MPLPGHGESYNPPPEYLLAPDEQVDEEEGQLQPRKFDSLRSVPAYSNFVRERYERCLDLYLCPRKLKKRLN
ncbi:hypothetical protein EON64_14225, partial [archaeon]